MADYSFYVLVPNVISDAAVIACSTPAPDGGRTLKDGNVEVAWVTGTNYAKGRYIAYAPTRRIYRDAVGGVSNIAPPGEPLRWFDMGPMNKWAWADAKHGTRTVSAAPWTVTVRPGAFSSIEFMGLSNVVDVRVEIWSTPGGTKVHDNTYSLEDSTGGLDLYWAYFFTLPKYGNTLSVTGLPVYPSCEVKITMTNYSGNVGIGLIGFGAYEGVGEPELDLEVSYRDFSRREWNLGELDFQIGPKAKDLKSTTILLREQANALDRSLVKFMNQGAIYVPSRQAQDRWMKCWGLLKPATLTLITQRKASLSIEVEGFSA